MENAFSLARISGRVFPGRFFVGAPGSVVFGFGVSPLLRLARTAVLLTLFAASFLSISITTANALPAGWKYELISPANTSGVDIGSAVGAPDGDHAWFQVGVPISQGQPSGNSTTFVGTRTHDGWKLRDLADPTMHGDLAYLGLIISEDSSRVVLQVCDSILINCPSDVTFVRVDQAGSRTLMATFPRVLLDPFPLLAGASSDLSRIVFENNTSSGAPPLLAADTHAQGMGLYSSHDGLLEFLGVDASDVPLPCGASLANNMNSTIGSGFEQSGVSADGKTIAFISPDPVESCPGPSDVYVRRDGHTVDISAPTNGNPDLGAAFVGASRDGNTIYLTTGSQLVTADTDSAVDLYAYDVPTAILTRITPGSDVGAVTVSPNGDYVYFVAAQPINGDGVAGQQNLFLYHAGAFTHVATTTTGGIALGRAMNDKPSPTTPDGTHLLFVSDDPLTGQPAGDNDQLFTYDATSDHLSCISCPSDGSTPTDAGGLPPAFPSANVFLRYQSDDGSRVAFSSATSLVPQDANGQNDVYLWHNGVVSLISRGFGEGHSQLASISADGKTVFFTSTDRLLPNVDQDNIKLYAAREGGGFPTTTPTPTCVDDACQGPPTLFPTFAAPISQTLLGPGNLKSALTKKTSKPLSKSQKLRKALKACKSRRSKAKRRKCESSARKRFGKSGGSK